MQKITNFITILFSALISLLSLVPPAEDLILKSGIWNKFLLYVSTYRFTYGVAMAAAIFIFNIANGFTKPRWSDAFTHKWAKNLLGYIIDYHLGGKSYETRATIFRAQKGIIFFIKYILFGLLPNILKDIKNKTCGLAFKNIPWHVFSKYLVIYERYSYPKQSKSYTYFRCSGLNDKPNSVVDKCYKEGIPVPVSTINISGINLPTEIDKLEQRNRKKVEKFMKDSYIRDYPTLLRLNRCANNLYAVPLTSDDETIWGVLIIDNIGNKKVDFAELLGQDIDKYQKIVSFTLSSMKK